MRFCIRLPSTETLQHSLFTFAFRRPVDGYRDGEEGSSVVRGLTTVKRGLLAPFAVGTIDQALIAVMKNVKHGLSRA